MSDSVKSLEINWATVVTRADPDWQRDGRHIPQLEPGNLPPKRELITVDWMTRHPYGAAKTYFIAEDNREYYTESGLNLIAESVVQAVAAAAAAPSRFATETGSEFRSEAAQPITPES